MIGRIEQLSISSPPAHNQQAPFPYPTIQSPVGRSYVPGGLPVTPGYSGALVPFGAQYSSPQTPVTGYTPGGYCTPSQYGSTSVTSDSSRLTTPTGRTWKNTGSPIRGVPNDESQSQLRLYGRRQNVARQNAVRGPGRPPFSSTVGQHNVVDVDRIAQGLDVRTTVSSFKQALNLFLMTTTTPPKAILPRSSLLRLISRSILSDLSPHSLPS